MAAAPMFHIADCAGLFGVNQAGGNWLFIYGFVPKLFFEAVSKNKINETILVPTMVNMAVNDPEIKNYDLSCLRKIMYGAYYARARYSKGNVNVSPNCTLLSCIWSNRMCTY